MRIASLSRTKRGDAGFSELTSNRKTSKRYSLCRLQNALQRLSVMMAEFETEYRPSVTLHPEVSCFFSLWDAFIDQHSNFISGCLYCNFDKGRIDELHLKTMQENTETLASHIDPLREFFKFRGNKELLALEALSIQARDVEHYFWELIHPFWFTNRFLMGIMNFLFRFFPPRYKEPISSIGQYLNLLSDWILTYARFRAKQLGIEPSYWQSSASD